MPGLITQDVNVDEPGRYGQPTPNYKCEKIPTTLYQTKQRLIYELYVGSKM